MHPVLFEIPAFGGIRIYSYGLMVALAFVAWTLWVYYESKRRGQDPGRALDLIFLIIFAAIVGSRLLHILVAEPERFFSNPLVFFRIWEGGLVFYGGLIGAVLVSFWFCRRHRLPALVYSDICAPAIPLGHAIGRLGCFLAGCCYGLPTNGMHWYSLVFPHDPHTFAPPGVPLYPTQLMESAGEASIFLILFVMRYRQKFDGQIIASYLMLYAVLRSTLECFRGDLERGFVIDPWLSTSQFISAIIFVLGLGLYLVGRNRWKRRGNA